MAQKSNPKKNKVSKKVQEQRDLDRKERAEKAMRQQERKERLKKAGIVVLVVILVLALGIPAVALQLLSAGGAA